MIEKLHKSALWYAGQVVVLAVVLFFGFDLGKRDIAVPFQFRHGGDVIHHLVITKAIISSGWWWEIKDLSAPFTLKMVVFPVGGNLDHLLIKFIACFSDRPGEVLNLFWLLSFILTGISANWSFRRLSFSSPIAFGLGILYALLPFAFDRNLAHLMLVYYLVPPICTLAITIVRWHRYPLTRIHLIILYAICVLVGINYIYTAFFSCFILLVAGILSQFTECPQGRRGRLKSAKLALGAILIVVISAFINLAPTLSLWRNDPPTRMNIGTKLVSDSEAYGLKLRHLILPIRNHPLPVLRHLAVKATEAKFPLENENRTAQLGLLGAIGFLMLLWVSVTSPVSSTPPDRHSQLLRDVSALNLAAFLLATIGGFGSLFALVVSPEIRAYNRLSVFIAFFSFFASGVLLSRLEKVTQGRRLARLIFSAVLSLIVLGGIFDQTSFAKFRRRHKANEARYTTLKSFVGELEQRLPVGAMIYQLPYSSYPRVPPPPYKMNRHEHLLPYLFSSNLRWSSPPLSGEAIAWHQPLRTMNGSKLVSHLSEEAFAGIWLDRFGYVDGGRELLRQLMEVPGTRKFHSADGRYVFVDFKMIFSNQKEP